MKNFEQKNVDQYTLEYMRQFSDKIQNNQLNREISELFRMEYEAGGFRHWPHLVNLGVDVGAIVVDVACRAPVSSAAKPIVNNLTNYAADYTAYMDNQKLIKKREQVSAKLMQTLSELPEPKSLEQAFALERFLGNVKTYFITEETANQIKSIKENARSKRLVLQQTFTDSQVMIMQNRVESLSKTQELLIELSTNHNKLLVDLSSETLRKTDLSSIENDLKTMGIELSSELSTLISQNEYAYQMMETLVEYNREQDKKRENEAKNQIYLQKHQGVIDACQFVLQLGIVTNSKPLQQVASIVDAGVKIKLASENLLSQALSLSSLSPISMIAMTTLSLVSIFKSSESPEQQIMKMLEQLSKQIDDLKREIKSELVQINVKLSYVLDQIRFEFLNLHNSLTVPIISSLSQLIESVQAISSQITQQNYDSRLHELRDSVNYVEDLENGIIPLPERDDFTKVSGGRASLDRHMQIFKRYASEVSRERLLNGGFYNDPDASRFIITRRKSLRPHDSLPLAAYTLVQVKHLLGLNMHTSSQHKIEHHSDIVLEDETIDLNLLSEDNIINPSIWAEAIKYYVRLKLQFPKYDYDPEDKQLNQMIKLGLLFRAFIVFLQKSPELYQVITDQLIGHIQNLQSILANNTMPSVIDFTKPIDKLLNELNDSKAKPNQPTFIYLRVNKGHGNAKFHDRYKSLQTLFSQAEMLTLLDDAGKTPAAIYLLAERLGIARFEYIVHQTASNGARQAVKTDGDRYGFEIKFYLREQPYTLANPGSSVHWPSNEGNNTHELKQVFLKNRKQCVNFIDNNPAEAICKKAVEECIAQIRIGSAHTIKSQMMTNALLEAIKKDHTILILCLLLAGFPQDFIDAWKTSIKIEETEEAIDSFLRSNTAVSSWPKIEVADFQSLQSNAEAARNTIVSHNASSSRLFSLASSTISEALSEVGAYQLMKSARNLQR